MPSLTVENYIKTIYQLSVDSGGDSGFGPKIGDPSEPFNFSLDCSGATSASIYAIEVRSGKGIVPVTTKWGFSYVGGAKLLGTVGAHAQSLVDWFPTPNGLALPNDPNLVGVSYTVQGFCGGYGPTGRLSNAITQTIGD